MRRYITCVEELVLQARSAEDAGKLQLAEHAYIDLVGAAEVIANDLITPRWDYLGQLLIYAQDFFLRLRQPQRVEAILLTIIKSWPPGEGREVRRAAWDRGYRARVMELDRISDYLISDGLEREPLLTAFLIGGYATDMSPSLKWLPSLQIAMRTGAGEDVLLAMINESSNIYLNIRDERNRLPLFYAVELNMEEVAEALIAKMSPESRRKAMNDLDYDGNTLLGIAITNCSVNLIKAIITAGAQIDPEFRNVGLPSYSALAVSRGDADIIGFLEGLGCKPFFNCDSYATANASSIPDYRGDLLRGPKSAISLFGPDYAINSGASSNAMFPQTSIATTKISDPGGIDNFVGSSNTGSGSNQSLYYTANMERLERLCLPLLGAINQDASGNVRHNPLVSHVERYQSDGLTSDTNNWMTAVNYGSPEGSNANVDDSGEERMTNGSNDYIAW